MVNVASFVPHVERVEALIIRLMVEVFQKMMRCRRQCTVLCIPNRKGFLMKFHRGDDSFVSFWFCFRGRAKTSSVEPAQLFLVLEIFNECFE